MPESSPQPVERVPDTADDDWTPDDYTQPEYDDPGDFAEPDHQMKEQADA